MKFKRKVYLLIFAVSSLLAVILLIWFSLFTINETLTRERFILRDIARQMEKVLLKNKDDEFKSIKLINDGLKFVRGSENTSYIVKDSQGNVFCSYNYRGNKDFPKLQKNAEHNYIFKWHSSFFQKWEFDFFYFGDDFSIALNSKRNIEILEALWPFFFVTVILILTFSFLLSHIIALILMKPIKKISQAAKEVTTGNFSYRIPLSGANDEVEKLEIDLNKTFESLEKSFNKISEFSSEVAHELRTPLTVLRGNLEVGIRQERSIEEYQCIITETIDEINKLQRLVNDMLMMLKPISTYDTALFQKINLSTELRKVIGKLSIISEAKNIKLEHSISPEIYVLGIESLLHRICFNLIHNAIKFSDKSASVNISLKKTGTNVKLSIADEGPGIKVEDFERVFQRFYRSANSTGHGLGLPMAKQLVELHGGALTLESDSAETCFCVSLPCHTRD